MSTSRFIDETFGTVRIYNPDLNKWVLLQSQEIGDLKHSIHTQDHQGWVLCDGRSLLRADYPDLFNLIGTTFGSVDSHSFNLPDPRGRTLGITGSGANLTPRSLGDTIGQETHTLTIQEMPSHNHGVTDPGHSHSYVNNNGSQGVNTLTTQASAESTSTQSQNTGTSTTGISINYNGNGQAFNVMQPTIFLGNIFIYGLIIHELSLL